MKELETEIEQLEVITGTVSAVLFTSEDNGYAVFRLDTDDMEGTSSVVVTGCFPLVSCGEDMSVTGSWTTHPSHGRQFKAEFAERQMPRRAEAIYNFLAGGAIKGIKAGLASFIVNRFGDDSLDVIENRPEELAEIKGISLSMAREFSEIYRQQSAFRRVLEFMCANGVRAYIAARMFRFHKESAMDVLGMNPYIIISPHIGGSFDEADRIAEDLGFEWDCDERIMAAVVFELRHNLNIGHCFIPKYKLIGAAAELIHVDIGRVESCIEDLITSGEIILDTVNGTEACYLPELYMAEQGIADRLYVLAKNCFNSERPFSEVLGTIQGKTGLTYSEDQVRILQSALTQGVTVITGGPGTGKTNSIKAILELFDSIPVKTLLAAPTGRAAKRITEVTGREAATIHRLLGAKCSEDGEHVFFDKNETDPLDCGAVILDECSMIDMLLFNSLLEALPDGCRLVLVGDADQLPPVGPGYAFDALIKSGMLSTIRLTKIFRQSGKSEIISNAHLINRGESPVLGKNTGDFFRIRRKENSQALATVCELCASRLPGRMGIEREDIQVLAPMRKGELGTVSLNRELQSVLNPSSGNKREKRFGEVTFREGDRVMQVRNNYDVPWHTLDFTITGTGIFNGDIGYIEEIDDSDETVTVNFDGRIAKLGFEFLGDIEHAWAITVHKSQGCEFRAVIIVLSDQRSPFLSRGILYTAVTRAKELLVLVGNDEDASAMIGNRKKQNRYSFLRSRLLKKFADEAS